MKMSVAEKPKQPMKVGWFKRARMWIAGLVKGFFEFLWDHFGWSLFAIVICSMGIALVVAWFLIR